MPYLEKYTEVAMPAWPKHRYGNSKMSYQFERGRIYRMPTHFGPAPGPRQIPADAVVDSTRSPQKMLITASFLTEASVLERFHYMTHVDWLADRGYTMIQLVARHFQRRA
jgi:hypothetical protein